MVRPGGYGLKPFLADGYLTQGATVRELAHKLGIDADNLERTVAVMNGYAKTGIDPEFARGSTPYHRAAGDPAVKPNPNLGPIAAAPFYAVKLMPGDIGAANGLVTSDDAQVIGYGRAADRRALRRRQRDAVLHGRHLSRPRHHARARHDLRLSRGATRFGQRFAFKLIASATAQYAAKSGAARINLFGGHRANCVTGVNSCCNAERMMLQCTLTTSRR